MKQQSRSNGRDAPVGGTMRTTDADETRRDRRPRTISEQRCPVANGVDHLNGGHKPSPASSSTFPTAGTKHRASWAAKTPTAAPAEAGAMERAAIAQHRLPCVAGQASRRLPTRHPARPPGRLGKGDACLAGHRDPNGRCREKTAHRARPRTQEPPACKPTGVFHRSRGITPVSPTALTLLDRKALTCSYAPDLDHLDHTRRDLQPVPGGTVSSERAAAANPTEPQPQGLHQSRSGPFPDQRSRQSPHRCHIRRSASRLRCTTSRRRTCW